MSNRESCDFINNNETNSRPNRDLVIDTTMMILDFCDRHKMTPEKLRGLFLSHCISQNRAINLPNFIQYVRLWTEKTSPDETFVNEILGLDYKDLRLSLDAFIPQEEYDEDSKIFESLLRSKFFNEYATDVDRLRYRKELMSADGIKKFRRFLYLPKAYTHDDFLILKRAAEEEFYAKQDEQTMP